MSHAFSLVTINAFASSWADTLVRACWQGGLGIALVWLICQLWPAMPPVPRCWLWRLAYAKLLLGLVWLPPLALPLLPHPPALPPLAPAAARLERKTQAPLMDMPLMASTATPPPFCTTHLIPAAPMPLPPLKTPRPLPTVQTWLLVVWLLGVLVSLGRVAAAWHRARLLYESSAPLADEVLRSDAADLCRRLGLGRVLPLRVAEDLLSPLLLGWGQPAILLPAFVLTDRPRSEVRLMLAHELAHLARRDLLWNVLPLLAQRLFFFHPLVWLAGHEWSLAQEIACDAQAVEVTGTPPAAYGRMLLGIATRRTSAPLFPTLAVAAPRHTLRRRLFAMQHIGTVSRPCALLAAALVAALAVGGLLPWRVVAQTGASVSTPPAVMQKEEASQEKVNAEFASRNAQLEAQLAALLQPLSPERQKKAQARIAFMAADDGKVQQHIQMLEQHRADYLAAHPNRLSDAQIALVQKVNWDKLDPSRIDEGIRWEQTIKHKLQAHLDAAHDTRSRQGWQRQIAAIDQRRRVAERQIRELQPAIAREEAEVAAIPEDQRARVAKLRSYDSEISAYKNIALMDKQMKIVVLRELLAGKLPVRQQRQQTTTKMSPTPPYTSAAPSGYTSTLFSFAPRGHRVRIFTQDATGQHLVLDKVSDGRPIVSPPVTATEGRKVYFLLYDNGKQVNGIMPGINRRGNTSAAQPNRPASAPVQVTPVMAEALDKEIARLEKQQNALLERQQRATNLLAPRTGVAEEGTGEAGEWAAITFLKARRVGAAWAQASIASPEFSPGLKGQKLANLRRFEQQAQQDKYIAEKYVFTLATLVTMQENRRTPLISFFSPHGPLRVRIFAQDTTGRHLVLDKIAHGKNLIIPSMPMKEGSKLNFLVYDNGKQVKDLWFDSKDAPLTAAAARDTLRL